ncbi:MAG: hypothetical protein CL677_03860 [Bdellovibrionaceae bacterium]|nr:hypothetical protein [Pseudobdellovibrionaceae bacterium]|tara:strand:+ start:17920 stop:18810 length:891 start_codon:yes stop_codon:yes gene_type:complete
MATPTRLSRQEIVDKLEEFPTLPTVIYELSNVINNPMSSATDVEKIMSNDVSLTTKVLKLANSAYYAIPGGVTSLSRAISYLGFDTVNQLVLSASILNALEFEGDAPFDMNDFWKHCIAVGIASETIAKATNHPLPSDMFTCGLIHDMGKVAYLTLDAPSVLAISSLAKSEGISYLEAETKLEFERHTTVGHLLAEKWQLPVQLQSVVLYHHEKNPDKRNYLSADLHQAVDIVYLANVFVHALKFGDAGHSKVYGMPKDVLERLAIDAKEGYKKILLEINTAIGRADEFIKIIGGS